MSIFEAIFQPEDKIITDLSVLQQVSRKTSLEECDKINLFSRLREVIKTGWTKGYGLSAIQIGIDLSALYYELNDKVIELVNPKIIEQTNKYITKLEGCLSFPNQRIDTYRYKSIIIEADVRTIYKDIVEISPYQKFSADDLEAHILEHEIDHCNGITIFERRAIIVPAKRDFHKVGRNEICPYCQSGKKYKHCCLEIIEAQESVRILESKE